GGPAVGSGGVSPPGVSAAGEPAASAAKPSGVCGGGFAKSVDAATSNGHPPLSRCARYSSRKYWMDDMIGATAPSPSAKNARPGILSERWGSCSRLSDL